MCAFCPGRARSRKERKQDRAVILSTVDKLHFPNWIASKLGKIFQPHAAWPLVRFGAPDNRVKYVQQC